jgi:outer membrane protein assembly factor BamA
VGLPYDSLAAERDVYRLQRMAYIYKVKLDTMRVAEGLKVLVFVQEILDIPIRLDLDRRSPVYGEGNMWRPYIRISYLFWYFLHQDQNLSLTGLYGFIGDEKAINFSWVNNRLLGSWFYLSLAGDYSSTPSEIYPAQFVGYAFSGSLGRLFARRWLYYVYGGFSNRSVKSIFANEAASGFDQDSTLYAGHAISYDCRNRRLDPDRGFYVRLNMAAYRTHYQSRDSSLYTPKYARLSGTFIKMFPLPFDQCIAFRAEGTLTSQILPHAMRTKYIPPSTSSTFRGFDQWKEYRGSDTLRFLYAGNRYIYHNLEYRFPIFRSPPLLKGFGPLQSWKKNARTRPWAQKLEEFYYTLKGFVGVDNVIIWGNPMEQEYREGGSYYHNLAAERFRLDREQVLTSVSTGLNYFLPTLGRSLSGGLTVNDRREWNLFAIYAVNF